MGKNGRGGGLVVLVMVGPRISIPLTKLQEVILIVRH